MHNLKLAEVAGQDDVQVVEVLIHGAMGPAGGIDSYHVDFYGAVGDGVTDDTDAFQFASQTGKLIQLSPNKTYRVTSAIDIADGGGFVGPRSAVVYADPAGFNNTNGSIGTRYGDNAVVFRMLGETSGSYTPLGFATLCGFTIDGGSVDGRITTTVAARNVGYLEICDLEIKNCCGTGIGAMSIGGGRIANCYIHDFYQNALANEYSGILCDGDLVNGIVSTDVAISGNTITSILFGPAAFAATGNGYQPNGIKCTERLSTGYRIIGNSVDRTGQGIDFYGSHSVVAHNVLTRCIVFGLKFIHGASNNQAYGNVITLFGEAGIAFDGDTTYNTEFNVAHDNTITAGGYDDWPVDGGGVHFADGSIAARGVDTACIVTHQNAGAGKATNSLIHHNVCIPGASCKYAFVRKGTSAQTNFWEQNLGVAGATGMVLAETGELGTYSIISTAPPSFNLTSAAAATIPLSIANLSNMAGTEAIFDISATNNPAGLRSCQIAAVNVTGSTASDLVFRTPNGAAPAEHLRITKDGQIVIKTLPTSSAGLATGTLWNSSGVVHVA